MYWLTDLSNDSLSQWGCLTWADECPVLPEPSQFAHAVFRLVWSIRQWARDHDPVNGCSCTFEWSELKCIWCTHFACHTTFNTLVQFQCLAAGSSILNREVESASMRPLARALTKNLDSLRCILRDQSLRNVTEYTETVSCSLPHSFRMVDKNIFSDSSLKFYHLGIIAILLELALKTPRLWSNVLISQRCLPSQTF